MCAQERVNLKYIYTTVTCGSMLKLSVLSIRVLRFPAVSLAEEAVFSDGGDVGLKRIRSETLSGAPLSYPPCISHDSHMT